MTDCDRPGGEFPPGESLVTRCGKPELPAEARLNPREIGIWPWGAKLAVLALLFLILMIFAGLFDWRDQWDQLEAGQKEEETLQQSWLTKKQQAVNLEAYRQQLKDIEQQFGALLKQLPCGRFVREDADMDLI